MSARTGIKTLVSHTMCILLKVRKRDKFLTLLSKFTVTTLL